MSAIPNIRQAFLDKNGDITPPWWNFLAGLSTGTNAVAQLQGELGSKQDQAAALDTLAEVSTAGVVVKLTNGEVTTRTLEGADGIAIVNPAGQAANPSFSLTDLADTGVGDQLSKITRDAKGRVEGTTAATAADLPYVNAVSELVADNTQAAVDEVARWVPYFSDTEPDETVHANWVDTVTLTQYVWYDDGDTAQWVQLEVPVPPVTDALVPYFVADGDEYEVPEYKQALFNQPISVAGTLVVTGMFIEVN